MLPRLPSSPRLQHVTGAVLARAGDLQTRMRAALDARIERASGAPPAPSALPALDVSGWIRFGSFALVGLFGGTILWAALAPISSAALGNGTIKVDTNRKIVQHLEGGIVRDILVREGQRVRQGDLLYRLDSIDADADRDSVQGQHDVLAARELRLRAQRDLSQKINASTPVGERTGPRFSAALEAQQSILEEQHAALSRQVEVWQRRKDQFTAQIRATQSHMASLNAQRPLLEEELNDARSMLSKGYGLKPRVLGLERQLESIKGEIATDEGKIASLNEQLSEADAQVLTITSAHARAVAEEWQDVQAKKAEIQDLLRKNVAKLGRREITAPVDGIVMNIRHFTTGGVVQAGGPLLDIVPIGEKLVVEVRLQPVDIDVVRPDLQASVRLVAYKQRSTPVLTGHVTRVSPDAVVDERTGAPHFTATVEVTADQLARAPHVRLYPGMPVEVAIVTGERTLLAYLAQPFTDSMSRAFRED
ncbi:MAG: hypothetical protein JWL93_1798 [Hyphomicrobiales bacterium]|nr:hypothetical protein [Hyphomicrobiales bacterium]